MVSNGLQRFLGDPGGIGAHIGNQTHQPLVARPLPLVKLLGHEHGLFSRKSQLPKGLLLQLAGGKGGGGIPQPFLFIDPGYPERFPGKLGNDPVGLFLIGDLGRLSLDLDQLGLKSGGGLPPASGLPLPGSAALLWTSIPWRQRPGFPVSRSQIRRTATDWTRPALRAPV